MATVIHGESRIVTYTRPELLENDIRYTYPIPRIVISSCLFLFSKKPSSAVNTDSSYDIRPKEEVEKDCINQKDICARYYIPKPFKAYGNNSYPK